MSSILHRLKRSVIRALLIAITFMMKLICSMLYCNRTKHLPTIHSSILLESATVLAEKIRQRKVKSEDVVKAYIHRIREVNSLLNAVVDTRYEDSIKEAQEVDKLIASGQKTENEFAQDVPLLGVPFTCKECIRVKGLHATAGLMSQQDEISYKDADVITLMKKAGAIILGVTNVPEGLAWFDTNNKLYGRTRNPYVTSRIAGGSSGGQACIISAAGSVIGLGSDMTGSVRMPCFINGIFGHKPTSGIVPLEGHLFCPPGELRSYAAIGPMCRYAVDLLPMLKILATDNLDKLKLGQPVDMRDINIYYIEDNSKCTLTTGVDVEVKHVMHKVVDYFRQKYGKEPIKIELPELFYSFGILQCILGQIFDKNVENILGADATRLRSSKEFFRWCIGRSKYSLSTIFTFKGFALMNKDPKYDQHIRSKHAALTKKMHQLLNENSVLLYPTHPRPAPYPEEVYVQIQEIVYPAIFNILQMPATHCTLALSSNGTPIGIEVAANCYQDRLTIAVAVELEKAFGGWIPPFPLPLSDILIKPNTDLN